MTDNNSNKKKRPEGPKTTPDQDGGWVYPQATHSSKGRTSGSTNNEFDPIDGTTRYYYVVAINHSKQTLRQSLPSSFDHLEWFRGFLEVLQATDNTATILPSNKAGTEKGALKDIEDIPDTDEKRFFFRSYCYNYSSNTANAGHPSAGNPKVTATEKFSLTFETKIQVRNIRQIKNLQAWLQVNNCTMDNTKNGSGTKEMAGFFVYHPPYNEMAAITSRNIYENTKEVPETLWVDVMTMKRENEYQQLQFLRVFSPPETKMQLVKALLEKANKKPEEYEPVFISLSSWQKLADDGKKTVCSKQEKFLECFCVEFVHGLKDSKTTILDEKDIDGGTTTIEEWVAATAHPTECITESTAQLFYKAEGSSNGLIALTYFPHNQEHVSDWLRQLESNLLQLMMDDDLKKIFKSPRNVLRRAKAREETEQEQEPSFELRAYDSVLQFTATQKDLEKMDEEDSDSEQPSRKNSYLHAAKSKPKKMHETPVPFDHTTQSWYTSPTPSDSSSSTSTDAEQNCNNSTKQNSGNRRISFKDDTRFPNRQGRGGGIRGPSLAQKQRGNNSYNGRDNRRTASTQHNPMRYGTRPLQTPQSQFLKNPPITTDNDGLPDKKEMEFLKFFTAATPAAPKSDKNGGGTTTQSALDANNAQTNEDSDDDAKPAAKITAATTETAATRGEERRSTKRQQDKSFLSDDGTELEEKKKLEALGNLTAATKIVITTRNPTKSTKRESDATPTAAGKSDNIGANQTNWIDMSVELSADSSLLASDGDEHRRQSATTEETPVEEKIGTGDEGKFNSKTTAHSREDNNKDQQHGRGPQLQDNSTTKDRANRAIAEEISIATEQSTAQSSITNTNASEASLVERFNLLQAQVQQQQVTISQASFTNTTASDATIAERLNLLQAQVALQQTTIDFLGTRERKYGRALNQIREAADAAKNAVNDEMQEIKSTTTKEFLKKAPRQEIEALRGEYQIAMQEQVKNHNEFALKTAQEFRLFYSQAEIILQEAFETTRQSFEDHLRITAQRIAQEAGLEDETDSDATPKAMALTWEERHDASAMFEEDYVNPDSLSISPEDEERMEALIAHHAKESAEKAKKPAAGTTNPYAKEKPGCASSSNQGEAPPNSTTLGAVSGASGLSSLQKALGEQHSKTKSSPSSMSEKKSNKDTKPHGISTEDISSSSDESSDIEYVKMTAAPIKARHIKQEKDTSMMSLDLSNIQESQSSPPSPNREVWRDE